MKFVIALLMLWVSIPALAADVNGKWKASFQDPNGQNMVIIFDLKVDGEKLTGTADSPMGNNTITEGKLVGDAISFTVDAGDMYLYNRRFTRFPDGLFRPSSSMSSAPPIC